MTTGVFLRLTAHYLRPHLRRQVEISAYMLLGLAFTMAFPFVLRRLLDTAIPRHDFGQVMKLLAGISVVLLISMLADLRRSYVSAIVSASIVRQVRSEMFARLQVLSSGWYAHSQQGDVLSRLFSDVGQMESGVSQTLREGSFQILSLVVSGIVALELEPGLGVIVLVTVPLLAVIYRLMAKGAQRRSLAVQQELGAVVGVAAENYAAHSVVKAFALERREGDRFARASDRLFERQLRLQLFSGFFGLSVNLVVTALRLVVLGLGSWMVIRGDITIGTLVAFTSIVGQVVTPAGVLTSIGQQVQAATGALTRINDVLTSVPDIAELGGAPDLPPMTNEVRLDHVGFSYGAGHPVLDGITCVIRAGERVAFVGPTGAGKTSLLLLVARFYDVSSGTVSVDGVDIRRVSLSSLRAQIGMVFQDNVMFDTTIRENIALGKADATEAEIERAARAAEVHDDIISMPLGYETTVGERGERLSGGQRQRLAIARAVIRNPRLLLLDEATSDLDPVTERLIADTLERVGEGRSTLSVTHRISTITAYDRIFVVVGGRIVESGTHAELVGRGGVYTAMWTEQAGGEHRSTLAARFGDRLPPAYAREPEPLPSAPATPFAMTPAEAWGGSRGAGVRIAVIDSGIEAAHPDLGGCIDVDAGIEIVGDNHGHLLERAGDHPDASGHGTACAGIIHAMAPDARITSVKVLGTEASGRAAAMLRGLDWAIEQRFDIVNLSIGTTRRDAALALYELCDRAVFAKTFIVTAANNLTHASFPSMFASVTSVACGPAHDPFDFDSNPDPPTDFLARGIDVDVAWHGGGRSRVTGNSFAAAHLAGIAALIASRHPGLGLFQMKTILWATSSNVRAARGSQGADNGAEQD